MNQYQYRHELGVIVTSYYVDSIDEVGNLNYLNQLIYEADNFWKKYFPNIFSNSFINLWSAKRSDIPRNQYDSSGKLVSYGVGDWGGLSFAKEKRIDLNSNSIYTDPLLKLAFLHEKGHELDYAMDLGNDPSDIIISEYNKIESAVNGTSTSPPIERMAEHILEAMIGFGRGTFKSIWSIQGLRDMLLIWHPVATFVKAIKSHTGKINPVNVYHNYSNDDFNYYSITFLAEYPDGQKYWYHCNRDGWQQHFSNLNQWKYIKYF